MKRSARLSGLTGLPIVVLGRHTSSLLTALPEKHYLEKSLALFGLQGERTARTLRAKLSTLVVRSIKTNTYQVTPRSNLFQRNTTGDALISAMPLRMRCFRSSFDVTRMCRRNVRAILEKAHSIKLSQEPCLGV